MSAAHAADLAHAPVIAVEETPGHTRRETVAETTVIKTADIEALTVTVVTGVMIVTEAVVAMIAAEIVTIDVMIDVMKGAMIGAKWAAEAVTKDAL